MTRKEVGGKYHKSIVIQYYLWRTPKTFKFQSVFIKGIYHEACTELNQLFFCSFFSLTLLTFIRQRLPFTTPPPMYIFRTYEVERTSFILGHSSTRCLAAYISGVRYSNSTGHPTFETSNWTRGSTFCSNHVHYHIQRLSSRLER